MTIKYINTTDIKSGSVFWMCHKVPCPFAQPLVSAFMCHQLQGHSAKLQPRDESPVWALWSAETPCQRTRTDCNTKQRPQRQRLSERVWVWVWFHGLHASWGSRLQLDDEDVIFKTKCQPNSFRSENPFKPQIDLMYCRNELKLGCLIYKHTGCIAGCAN